MEDTEGSSCLPGGLQEVLGKNGFRSLSDVKLSTVTALRNHNSSLASNIQPRRKKCNQNRDVSSKGWTALPEKSLVLLGHITGTPKSLQSKNPIGQLYFQDKTDAIKCGLAWDIDVYIQAWDIDITYYKKLVALVQWNLIVQDSEYYLEIQKAIKMEGVPVPAPAIEVVDVRAAHIAMQHRDKLAGALLNVVGTVTALSELFRVHTTYMFLINLSQENAREFSYHGDTVNILLKTNSRLYWQNFICPQEDYVFTKLRPTTMKKGSDTPQTILVPWDEAEFYPAACVPWTKVTLEEWVKTNSDHHSDTSVEFPVHTGDADNRDLDQNDNPKQKLYTYQGVITSTSGADHGMYELDGKIGLYLSFIGSRNTFRYLRAGTRVLISNAHHKGASEPPKVRLCCCTLGCVKVKEFSTWDTPVQVQDCNSCELHLVDSLSLGLPGLMWLQSVKEKLEKKLCPAIIRSDISSVFKKILSSPNAVNGDQMLHSLPAVRNQVQEFLLHSKNNCLVLAPQIKTPLSSYPSVEEITLRCQNEADNLKNFKKLHDGRLQSSTDLNKALYWHYNIVDSSDLNPPLVLVGVLQTCKKTGHVQLADQTGRLNCVIAPRPSSRDEHSCLKCCNSDSAKPENCCPFIQTWNLGALVRIDKFQLVTEKFIVSNFPSVHQIGDMTFVQNLKTKVYLMFSMLDIVRLSKPKSSLPTPKVLKSETSKLPEKVWTLQTEPDVQPSTSSNGALNTASQDNGSHKRIMESDGAQAKPVKLQKTDNHPEGVDACVTQLLLLTHKDTLNVKYRVNEKPRLCFYALATFIGKSKVQNYQTALTDASWETSQNCHASLPVKHIALAFYGEEVRWFPLLHAGNLYRLVRMGCRDRSVFECKLKHAGIKQAVESTNARQYVVVESGTDIVRLPVFANPAGVAAEGVSGHLPTPELVQVEYVDPSEAACYRKVKSDLESRGHLASYVNVRDVTLDICKQKLVSVQGLVFSTTFCLPDTYGQLVSPKSAAIMEQDEKDNDRLGVSVPQNRSIRLVLRDVETTDEVLVFIRPDNISYPLGLVRGTLVEFDKLEVKVSRNQNVYCQYMVASSYRVVQLPGNDCIGLRSKPDSPSVNLTSLPHQYLRELWYNSSAKLQFFTVCHIQQVLRLSISAQCMECGTRHRAGICTNPSCMSTTSPNINTKSSIIVDDGTGSAMVFCTSDVVQELLACTAPEWSALESAAAEQGELHYTMYNQYGSVQSLDPVSRLLKLLCESSEVRRSVSLYARYNRSERNRCQNISEFEVKSVDIGGERISTHSLPLLKLYGLAIRKTATQDYINKLLNTGSQ